MSLITRKLLRDFAAGRRQFVAVTSVVVLGGTFFNASYSAYQNLYGSYERYYREQHFADFTIRFDSAPEDIVDRIRQLDGVTAVTGRLTEEIALHLTGCESPEVIGRIVSCPEGDRPEVNNLLMLEGEYFGHNSRREVLLPQGFARYHGLKIGDYVYPRVRGREERFRVAGIAASPEYIMMVRNKTYLIPMLTSFTVLFMPQQQAERLLGMRGRINEICATAESQYRDTAMWQAYERLKPYGAEEPVPKEQWPSHRLLKMDLDAFRELAVMFPALFMAIAGLTIYTLLTRLVHAQRQQIGFLRAAGFTTRQVLHHYWAFALLIGAAGGVLGSLFGHLLTTVATEAYVRTLHVPVVDLTPRWGTLLFGFALALVVCLVAGSVPARAAARLHPAIAMRDEIPLAQTRGQRRRLSILRNSPPLIKLPVRSLLRNLPRTVYTVFGVASAVALIMVPASMMDSMHATTDLYVNKTQLYDLRVSFLPEVSEDVQFEIAKWDGVEFVQSGLQALVELSNGDRVYPTMLAGLPTHSETTYRLNRLDGGVWQTPRDGILIGQVVKERLGLEIGDLVTVSYPKTSENLKATYRVPVVGVVHQPVGTLVFMHRDKVRRMFREAMRLPPKAVSGVSLLVAPEYREKVRQLLYGLPHAASVDETEQLRRNLDEMMDFNYLFTGALFVFGTALAFAIVFNTMTINVLERSREVATLRTLGMRRRTLAQILTFENVATALLGVALGLPLGYQLAEYFSQIYSNEVLTLWFVIHPRTYALAVLGILGVVLLSQIPSIRYVNQMDLATAAKERAG